jgi:hypothetical protein
VFEQLSVVTFHEGAIYMDTITDKIKEGLREQRLKAELEEQKALLEKQSKQPLKRRDSFEQIGNFSIKEV